VTFLQFVPNAFFLIMISQPFGGNIFVVESPKLTVLGFKARLLSLSPFYPTFGRKQVVQLASFCFFIFKEVSTSELSKKLKYHNVEPLP